MSDSVKDAVLALVRVDTRAEEAQLHAILDANEAELAALRSRLEAAEHDLAEVLRCFKSDAEGRTEGAMVSILNSLRARRG